MMAIVDYGLGNAQAFHDIYRRIGVPVVMARLPSDLESATHVILPGVGAFDWAMSRLGDSGLHRALEEAVIGRGAPVLGICVGMQILADRSEEGRLPGLGWIHGTVRRFDIPNVPGAARLPHMGWNDVQPVGHGRLFEGLDAAPRFYFLHSYYFDPQDHAVIAGSSHYHAEFTCAVSLGNIHGVQFHPEKSHGWGVSLLRNFARL
jgi:glutamine amidotransferase